MGAVSALRQDRCDNEQTRQISPEPLGTGIASAPSQADAAPKNAAICSFKKAQDVWSLRFDGKDCNVIDSVGMLYIARILEAKGAELDAETLSAFASPVIGSGGRRTKADRQDRDAQTSG